MLNKSQIEKLLEKKTISELKDIAFKSHEPDEVWAHLDELEHRIIKAKVNADFHERQALKWRKKYQEEIETK